MGSLTWQSPLAPENAHFILLQQKVHRLVVLIENAPSEPERRKISPLSFSFAHCLVRGMVTIPIFKHFRLESSVRCAYLRSLQNKIFCPVRVCVCVFFFFACGLWTLLVNISAQCGMLFMFMVTEAEWLSDVTGR